MRIQHNIAALSAYRNLTNNNSAVSKNLEKLSSGYRINRAGDDAAGLAISEKMRAQITGLQTAQKNANDGISLVQTAEGALTEVHSMLNRMVELANQSANGTYANAVDRENLQEEINSLKTEIDRISQSTNFNGINLLDGSLGLNAEAFQIGEAKAGTDVGTIKGADVGTFSNVHEGEAGAVEQEPSFKINLGDYAVDIKAGATAAQSVSFGLKIGNETITIADSNAALGTASTAVVFKGTGEAAVTAKTATDVAGLFNNKFAVIGDDVYKMTNNGAEISFEYQGQKKADGTLEAKTGAAGKWTEDSFVPKGKVEITTTDADTIATVKNRDNCHVTEIKDPVVAGEQKRAGISLKLTQDIIDKGSLTIGDVTFKFDKTKTEAEAAADGDKKVIGIKDIEGETALLQAVTRQMSNYTDDIKITKDGKEYKFTIGRGDGTDVIEIEEKAVDDPAATPYGAFTEAELKDAFSQSTAAVAASRTLTIAKAPTEGESIKIGENTYVFGSGTDKDKTKYVALGSSAADSAANLAAKIGSNAKAEGAKVIVSAATTGANSKAPEIGSAGLTLQVGDSAADFNQLTVEVNSMSSTALGIGDINIGTQGGAKAAVDKIKDAINLVSSQRGKLGAIQNRLEHTINNLSVTTENITAAESRIRDVDVAEEMMAYTKNNILVQSAQAMLAQANQIPQGVLQLLQ